MNKDLIDIVERYKNSSNKNKKYDYIKMMEVIESFELSIEERTEIEDIVINHFLNNSPKGKELFNLLNEKEQQKCIDGDELAKLYVESLPENREIVYQEFKNLYADSNPDTKAYLMNLERWKMRKSKIADKLRAKMQNQNISIESKSIELTYLQDGVQQLLECTSVPQLIDCYENIGTPIANLIDKEEMLDKNKKEHKKAFGILSSTYFNKLQQLEGELTLLHQCNNNQVLQSINNRLRKVKENEDVQEVLDEIFEILEYRMKTHRTYPNTEEGQYILQKFLSACLMFKYGKLDINDLCNYIVDDVQITEEFLAEHLPFNVTDKILSI